MPDSVGDQEAALSLQEPPTNEVTSPFDVRRALKVVVGLGATSLVVAAFSAVRTKVVAVELGPSGVATVALIPAALAPIAVLFGVALSANAVQRLASARAEGTDAEAVTRWTVFFLGVASAMTSAAVVVALAPLISHGILDDAVSVAQARLLGISAAATLLSQTAGVLLTGYRRMRALAGMQLASGVLSAVTAVVLLLLGVDFLIAIFVVPAFLAILVAGAAIGAVPAALRPVPLRRIRPVARALFLFGLIFLLTAIVSTVGQLLARVIIDDLAGREELGYFQAAFGVAGVYMAMVLTAITTDFVPQLGEIRHDAARMNSATNGQLETALLIAAPLVCVCIVAAPALIRLLYSAEFQPAVEMLRVQLVGEGLKIAAWTIGFILVATERRTLFASVEIAWTTSFLLALLAFIPDFGVEAANVAYAACFGLTLLLTLLLVRRASGFRLTRTNAMLIALSTALAILVAILASLGVPGMVVAAVISAAFTAGALWRLRALARR
jgi:O-antigen/teichoic acid export membrane protein